MSGWDAYINALKGDGSVITGAAIFGQSEPPALWAASSATFISGEEVATLQKGIKDTSAVQGSGFKIGGEKYMTLHSEAGANLRGKKGEFAAAGAFSKKAIVIAVGKASPQEVSNAAEKMAADLASKGF